MQHDFWQSRWERGHIGFHSEGVNPNLVRHAATWLGTSQQATNTEPETNLDLAEECILVPLAGKSVDITWLAARGACVVAVEFVERAVRSYFDELGQKPLERPFDVGLRFDACVPTHAGTSGAGSVAFWAADFFALRPEHVGTLTAVYDRAALVAICPERRRNYVEHVASLLPKGARLLLVSFDHDQPGGPPFSVPPEQVTALLEPWFTLTLLSNDDILEQEPRFKQRGVTCFREHVWLGVRR